jgi:Tfp pilus assembly PilM family ATPase
MQVVLQTAGAYRLTVSIMKKNISRIWGLHTVEDVVCMVSYLPDEHAVNSIIINPVQAGGRQPLADELLRIHKKLKFSGDPVAVSLSCAEAVISPCEMDRDTADVAARVQWHVAQQVMEPVQEYAIDFQTIDDDPDTNVLRVLTAAYKYDPVQELVRQLRKGKLHPVYFTLDIFSLINTFANSYRDRLETPLLLLYGSSDTLLFVVTRHGQWIDHEMVPMDPAKATDAHYRDAFERGRAILVSANREEFGTDEVPCMYSGPLFSQTDVSTILHQVFPQAEKLDPFRDIALYVQMDDATKEKYVPYLSIAAGAAVDAATLYVSR